MVTGAYDDTVRVWALASGREVGAPLKLSTVRRPRRRRRLDEPRRSRDRRRHALRPTDPGVQIFDVATHRRVAALSDDDSVWEFARFTPDGHYIVGGSVNGWVRLWSTKTWQPATRVLGGHSAEVIGSR